MNRAQAFGIIAANSPSMARNLMLFSMARPRRAPQYGGYIDLTPMGKLMQSSLLQVKEQAKRWGIDLKVPNVAGILDLVAHGVLSPEQGLSWTMQTRAVLMNQLQARVSMLYRDKEYQLRKDEFQEKLKLYKEQIESEHLLQKERKANYIAKMYDLATKIQGNIFLGAFERLEADSKLITTNQQTQRIITDLMRKLASTPVGVAFARQTLDILDQIKQLEEDNPKAIYELQQNIRLAHILRTAQSRAIVDTFHALMKNNPEDIDVIGIADSAAMTVFDKYGQKSVEAFLNNKEKIDLNRDEAEKLLHKYHDIMGFFDRNGALKAQVSKFTADALVKNGGLGVQDIKEDLYVFSKLHKETISKGIPEGAKTLAGFASEGVSFDVEETPKGPSFIDEPYVQDVTGSSIIGLSDLGGTEDVGLAKKDPFVEAISQFLDWVEKAKEVFGEHTYESDSIVQEAMDLSSVPQYLPSSTDITKNAQPVASLADNTTSDNSSIETVTLADLLK